MKPITRYREICRLVGTELAQARRRQRLSLLLRLRAHGLDLSERTNRLVGESLLQTTQILNGQLKPP